MCDDLGAGDASSAGDSTFEGRIERCVEDVAGDGLHMRISSGEQRLTSRDRMVVAQRQGFELPVTLTAGDLAGLALLLAMAALLSALPAWLAYRQPPVASLRG